MYRVVVGVVVLVVTNCASEGAQAARALSLAEETAFEACWSLVRGRNCQEGPRGVHGDMCMRDIADRYAHVPTAAARRGTLVSLGCPAPLVDGALSR